MKKVLILFALLFLLTFGVPMFAAFHTQGSSDLVSLLHSAVLTAPETRSSSPVRILRGDNRQSAVAGLYPTGEGAGYAGGIMSAAIDGMLTAEAILQTLQEEKR